jgi:hypothetical protein
MIGKVKYIICVALFLTALGCRKPYLPAIIATNASLLVVEGAINPGADSTVIKLSHTVKLSEKTTSQPETGATVTVEGNGAVYHLAEIGSGTYAATGLSLNSAQKYRLKIHTAGGQDYLSDEMDVKITPPIDSLSYTMGDDGLHFFSATHDPTNNTRFYRWDYQETWRFNALFESKLKTVANLDTIVPREYPQDNIYKCFGFHQASTILLGTSNKIEQDIITNNPITQIIPTSEKVSIRYSLLVRQYALTKEAYAFWENLKKNTEQLGSIFDALPSEISGNIHNVANPSTPVIGYISISTVTTKRIYVDRTELPGTYVWRTLYPYEGCAAGKSYFVDASGVNTVESNIIQSANVPLTAITVFDPATGGDKIIGYYYSARTCADCTIRGFNTKPAFWVDK